MTDAGPTDVDAYERGVSARMDADVAMVMAQGEQFQQQFRAMTAAWQPMPPQMFAYRADGLAQWVQYFRQAAGPAVAWLAQQGRPATGQRLAAILDDLEKAVVTYRQMAGQQVAHSRALDQATINANREITGVWAATSSERSAAHAARSAQGRELL